MSNTRLFVIAGVLIALGLAMFVSPWASGDPDGLNRVAVDKGFDDRERSHSLEDGPLAGYSVRGVGDERASKAVSGVIGVLITFGVGLGLFGVLRARKPETPDSSSGGHT